MTDLLVKAEDSELHNEKYAHIVRLYNENGEHRATLLPCGVRENGKITCWDLANPDGKVYHCSITNEMVDSFAELFGWDKFEYGKYCGV